MRAFAHAIVTTVVTALVLAGGARVAAQSNTSTVTGIVQDDQGLVLPGASVELVSVDTGAIRTAVSSESGSFTITAVPQGRYTLKVSLEGFKTMERQGIQLTANESYSAGNIQLAVGQITEVATVTADLGNLQTASSEISTVLEAKAIDSLIARGRDPMSFFRVMPGVSVSGDGPVSLGGTNGSALPNISGLPANLGGITLDGMATNDADTNNQISTIGVDAIEEIKVIANNYQAEFGRAAGASMSIISKSGTRTFKGSYAYYVRNEAFNANNYFNNLNGLEKPFYRYNTGSGTLGGPIGKPGGNNRLFFFYAREDWVTDEPRDVVRTTMPTALERQGDFSQSVDLNGRLIPVIDPLTRQPFPGNRIPADRIDRYGQGMLGLLPLPNFTDTAISGRNYNYQYQDIAHTTKAMNHVKVDIDATSHDRFTVLARNWDPRTIGYSGLFGITSNYDQLRHNYAKSEYDLQLKHVRTFGRGLVNEASFSRRRTHEIYTDPDFPDISLDNLGLAGLPQLYEGANPFDIFPQVSFAGVPSPGTVSFDSRFPINAGDVRRAFSDTLSWATSKHLIKAGVYYEWNYNSEGLNANCYSGCFSFSTDTNDPNNSGYAYANTLLGNFQSYSQSNQRVFRGGRNSIVEGFVQDSWKPRGDLTFDLGVRISTARPWKLDTLKYGWPEDVAASEALGVVGGAFVADRFSPDRQPRLFFPALVNGRRVGVDQATGQVVPAALIGSIVPGSGDTFNGLVTEDDPLARDGFRDVPPLQFGPRFGFAYNVRGKGTTAIRGGFGITRQTITASGSFANSVAAGAPARVQPTVFYGNIATLAQSTGYLAPFAADGFTRDWKPTTVYNFSINVQQKLWADTVASVAYVGNRARHLPLTQDINVVAPGARFDRVNVDPTNGRALPDSFLRPKIGYGTINIVTDHGESDYDALQVTVNRRYRNGLQFAGAYTLSSTHDMSGTEPLYRNARDYLYDYATFDQRHVLTLSYVWDIPGGSRFWNNPVGRALLDRWQFAGVGSFVSGRPAPVTFTTTDSADILGGGDPGRINVTCDPNLPRGERSFTRWFDTSCFARPGRGDEGNASRNPVRLPGSNSWDLTLSKMLIGRAGRGAQFRAELYNAFNQVIWTNVNTAARFDQAGNQVNPQFGQVIAAGNPRIIQLAIRVMF